MAERVRRAVSDLTQLPAVTAGNIAFALLALPLFVLAIGVFDTDVHPIVTIGVHWVFAVLVIGIAVGAEELSLTDMGFRRPAWIDLGYVVVTSIAILLVYALTDPLVEALGLTVREGIGAMGGGAGVGVALALAVTTGVVEEILYRGYPIERLLAQTERPLVAGGLTWGVFTVAHALR